MTARTALAVIDHNSNLNRAQVSNMIDIVIDWIMDGYFIIIQAVTKAGQPRYRTECDRGGTKWYSREILVRQGL